MRHLIVIMLGLALSACVHTRGTMLDNHTAIISARGNAFASSTQMVQGLLREAAELAQNRGFARFIIVDSTDRSSTGTIYTPGSATTTGTYGRGYYSAQTTYNPAQAYSFIRPGVDVIVVMYSEADAPQGAWSAAEILANQPRRN
jgi:hypothetical protein